MTSRNQMMITLAFTLLGVIALTTGNATAQSDSALRRENDALRAQVGDLEAELKAARQRIQELESLVARLESQVERLERGGRTGPDPTEDMPEEKVTIDESVPDASPRALLAAMQDSYKETLADRSMGAPNSQDRGVYLKAVERWARQVNRQHRGQIEWHVVVERAEPGPRGTIALTLQAVDPVTEVFLGDPFPALVDSRTLIRRIDDLARNNQLIDTEFVMKGVLEPQIRVNSNRESAGTFNNPPLIGPFAEFQFFVDVRVLKEPEEQPQEPARSAS